MPVRTRLITHNGVTLSVTEWAKRTKQLSSTLSYRLDAGWSIEDALFQPLRNCGRKSLTNERVDRELKIKAVQIKRAFERLVTDIDHALKVYKARTDWLLDTPGVVDMPQETAPDRTIPSAQDSPNLEISDAHD